MAGIYLHIPFCKQACYYCDFHFSTDQQHRSSLIDAMVKEIALQREYLDGEVIETIYFGGGTPSILHPDEIKVLLASIHENHSVANQLEITLEANPDDLMAEKLDGFRQAGMNRLSIGIQSFDEHVLKFLNRAHDGHQAEACIRDARQAGFNNISIDLIFAIPGQDQDTWKKNIQHAIELDPEHISAYSLTIEEKTAFGKWQKTGKLIAVDEEVAATQFEMLMQMTKDGGYEQYEISNFCKPGFYSRHNSSYWRQKKYLGIGPSAHSYDGFTRQFNVRSNALYAKSIAQGTVPFEKEILTRENKVNEYIFTTLRTSRGSDLAYLKQEFGVDLRLNNQNYLSQLLEKKFVVLSDDFLTLTNSGKLIADKIASDLFISER